MFTIRAPKSHKYRTGTTGGQSTYDPLRIESGVTLITLTKVGNGTTGSRYACRTTGSGKDERVTVLGVVSQEFGDLNAARHAARRACEKGRSCAAVSGTDNRVYLVNVINGTEAAQVARSILDARMDARRQAFALGSATQKYLSDVAGASVGAAPKPKFDPEGIALGYATGLDPIKSLLDNAKLLLVLCETNEDRIALAKAFLDVSGIIASDNFKLANLMLDVAVVLEQNNASRLPELRRHYLLP